ncbi:hypothetical protein GCM10009678_29370 [Actinomadura kijaniata]|uniref:Uncharacterized protein n=1 Tax=Actinomadura namibiensis TaxID=182080 RepID=A0A7W3QJM6_ACTNM|nr:hypothetical protein [Actinomadura namibiensis]MBA8949540.1 hypothetical protein [Actinomadura namibiensis]
MRRRPYLILLAFVVAVGGLVQTPPGRSLLESAGLVGATEHYSELAFTDPGQLQRVLVGGSELPLAFSIHNATDRRRTYTWSVTATVQNATPQAGTAQNAVQRLDGGQTVLAPDEDATITTRPRVMCRPGTLRVEVRLDDRRAIAYQAECVNDIGSRQG